jgi:hypothetical protein
MPSFIGNVFSRKMVSISTRLKAVSIAAFYPNNFVLTLFLETFNPTTSLYPYITPFSYLIPKHVLFFVFPIAMLVSLPL